MILRTEAQKIHRRQLYRVCYRKLLIGIANACLKIQDPISYQGSRGTILVTKAKVEYTEQIKQWHIMK